MVDEAVHERVSSCEDLEQLRRWLHRAAVGTSPNELFIEASDGLAGAGILTFLGGWFRGEWWFSWNRFALVARGVGENVEALRCGVHGGLDPV